MGKKLLIKGVGSIMARKVNCGTGAVGSEIITLGTLQDLRIDMSVELEDIYGGDSLFPIDTLVRNKSIEITATDAKFDLNAVRLMMGSGDVQELLSTSNEGYVWRLGEKYTLGASGAPSSDLCEVMLNDAVKAGTYSEVVVKFDDSNDAQLTHVTYTDGMTLGSNEFAIRNSAGNDYIVLDDAHAGKDIIVSYKVASDVDLLELLKDEVPFNVSIIHHGVFTQKCGTKRGIETELYSCRARGTFSIGAQRATASTSQLSLQLVDPERADGRIGTIKLFDV